MAKKPKTRPVPKPPTRAELVADVRQRLRDVLPSYFETYTKRIEKFQAAVIENGVEHALMWEAEDALVASWVSDWLRASGLLTVIENPDEIAADRVEHLKLIERTFLDRLLRGDDFRPNSTSPMRNINNQCQYRARQVVLAAVSWTLWEVDLLRRLEAKTDADDLSDVDLYNPNRLL